MWPIRRPVFTPTPERIISSSVHRVPSKSTSSAPAKAGRERIGHPRAGGYVVEPGGTAGVAHLQRDGVFLDGTEVRAPRFVLEPQRDLARHRERHHHHAARGAVGRQDRQWLIQPHRLAGHEPRVEHVEHRVSTSSTERTRSVA